MDVASTTSIAHEDPRLLGGLFALAGDYPGERFLVTSGDRTRQPARGFGGHLAPEGKSFHERYAYGLGDDEAVDVTIGGRPVGKRFTAFELGLHGLQTPVLGDDVHLTSQGWNG